MELNSENAKSFNASLKAAIKKITNQKVKVHIINSYKFPDCYVRVHAESVFNNDFRLGIFDACGNKRENLQNTKDVCYGNIGYADIAAKVFQWEAFIKTF